MDRNKGTFLNRLERKWGHYAIPNLTMYLVAMYVIGFILRIVAPNLYNLFGLDMYYVFQGQVWRLVTFLLIPPDTSLLIVITLLFYASIGQTLERTWGTFYYNVYMISGVLFTILGNLIAFLLQWLITGEATNCIGTNYYILMSMFLAFAYLYPDMEVLLMFIIPIKVKWMAYVYYAIIAYQVYRYVSIFINAETAYAGYAASDIAYVKGLAIGSAISIVMSLLNFFLFYYSSKKKMQPSRAQKKRKKNFQAKMVQPQGITRHKCAVCGATEETNPELEFRFCSKCKGNYEYCQNHLFTHEHVR